MTKVTVAENNRSPDERSEIRGQVMLSGPHEVPHSASLHAGYACLLSRKNAVSAQPARRFVVEGIYLSIKSNGKIRH
jgi:hypothetical protein